MKNILLCFFLFHVIQGVSQTGSISGNAFWHYNDFVGNKPDAGSYVLIIPSDTTIETQETQCDVQGNFTLELDTGYYLIIIRSKNTTSGGEDNFNYLSDTNYTSHYLGFTLEGLNPTLYDSIGYYHQIVDSFSRTQPKAFGTNKYLKNYYKALGNYRSAIIRLLALIPYNKRYSEAMLNAPVLGKIYIEQVLVKSNKTKTVIADFGATYF